MRSSDIKTRKFPSLQAYLAQLEADKAEKQGSLRESPPIIRHGVVRTQGQQKDGTTSKKLGRNGD